MHTTQAAIVSKERAAILSMHQMAEVPIQLFTDSILDQVFEGELLSETSINH